MHLLQGTRADPHTDSRPDWVHPALIRFADECSVTFGHLIIYVGTLAVLAIAGVQLWHRLPATIENQPAVAASWAAATRSFPALTAIQPELIEKTSTYDITRRAYGGRNDVIPEGVAGERPGWLGRTENPGLRGGL